MEINLEAGRMELPIKIVSGFLNLINHNSNNLVGSYSLTMLNKMMVEAA